jgi:hypothetical protein
MTSSDLRTAYFGSLDSIALGVMHMVMTAEMGTEGRFWMIELVCMVARCQVKSMQQR